MPEDFTQLTRLLKVSKPNSQFNQEIIHLIVQNEENNQINLFQKFSLDFGVTSGRPLYDFPCGFIFNSSVKLNGTFTSPNFPGLYPRNTECHYFFHGDDEEYVVLMFYYFHVEGVPP